MYILIIPLIKEVLHYIAEPHDIANAIRMNIFATVLVVCWAYLEYVSKGYFITDDKLFLESGFLVGHNFSIKFKDIRSISLKKTILNSIFSVAKLTIDTKACKNKAGDFHLTLKQKDAKHLFFGIVSQNNKEMICKPKIFQALVMSLSWSNPLTGFLFLLPVLNKIENIFGDDNLRSGIYSTMDQGVKLALKNMSPIAANLIRALLIGWVFAFSLNVFRFLSFNSFITGNLLFTARGLFNKIHKAVVCDDVNTVMIKQTIFMKIFKFYNVYADVSGHKKRKKDLNLIKIGCREHEIRGILAKFFKFFELKDQKMNISKDNRIMFLLPNIIISLIFLAIFILILLSKQRYLFIALSALFAALSLWLLILKILAFGKSGFSISEDVIVVNSYDSFSIYSVVIPANKIQMFKILPKKSDLCDLEIFVFSEAGNFFSIKNLGLTDTKEDFKKLKRICPLQK
jgi:uncharacterized membrane protein YdbT with pleckstrin-like domain